MRTITVREYLKYTDDSFMMIKEIYDYEKQFKIDLPNKSSLKEILLEQLLQICIYKFVVVVVYYIL